MSFLLYSKTVNEEKTTYTNLEKSYSLAGFNLIHSHWEKQNKPIGGWPISAEEMLSSLNKEYSSNTHALMVDFHPSALYRVGLVEILNIYVYTYGTHEKVEWSPLMLELKDVYYKEYSENQDAETIAKEKDRVETTTDRRIFEFLYLKGDDYSWNWGSSGRTNAAFIDEDARKYFAPIFNKFNI